jgi:ubiquinone/menaquinone biosynthesis C-methylase UbiE
MPTLSHRIRARTIQRAMAGSARYDDFVDVYDRSVGDDVGDPATRAVLDLLPPCDGLRLLDLACGQGRVARELARRRARVVGIDIADALLRRARTAESLDPLGITYLTADAARSDTLSGESFDGVVCNFGLADIDDLDGALATVARVLPDGCWFVFSILHPCFPGWDDDAPSTWPPEAGYYAEGWWRAQSTGYRGTVGANHRMLSTYLNHLARSGLAVTEVVEPSPGDAWSARAPGRAAVPVYFVARCRRISGAVEP